MKQFKPSLKQIITIAVPLVILLSTQALAATDWYVTPNGNSCPRVTGQTSMTMLAPNVCDMVDQTFNLIKQMGIVKAINQASIIVCMIALLMHTYSKMIVSSRHIEAFPAILKTMLAIVFINSCSPSNTQSLQFMMWRSFVDVHVTAESQAYQLLQPKLAQVTVAGVGSLVSFLPIGNAFSVAAKVGGSKVGGSVALSTMRTMENTAAKLARGGSQIPSQGGGAITAAGAIANSPFHWANVGYFFLTPFMSMYAYVIYTLCFAMVIACIAMPVAAAGAAILDSFKPLIANVIVMMSLMIGIAFAPAAFLIATEIGFIRPMQETIATLNGANSTYQQQRGALEQQAADNIKAHEAAAAAGEGMSCDKGFEFTAEYLQTMLTCGGQQFNLAIGKLDSFIQSADQNGGFIGMVTEAVRRAITGFLNSTILMLIGLVVGGALMTTIPYSAVQSINGIMSGGSPRISGSGINSGRSLNSSSRQQGRGGASHQAKMGRHQTRMNARKMKG